MSIPKSRLEQIGPDRAKRYLAMLGVNRNKKVAAINTYAAAMSRGEWIEDGPPIFFANGELIDGQNRLHAIVESGETITLRVTRHVDPKLKYALDTQSARNFNDVLVMEGYQNAALLAAAARLEWIYVRNERMTQLKAIRPTHFELLELVKETPGLVRSAKQANGWGKLFSGWCPSSIAAFLLHQFQARDQKEGHHFWYAMANGIGLEENDPILRLRNWLIKRANQAGNVGLTRRFQLAVFIKCWNAWLRGEEHSRPVGWRQGGYNPESFPVIESPVVVDD